MKTNSNYVNLNLKINWKTLNSNHCDEFHIQRVNVSRDLLYEYEPEALYNLYKGNTIQLDGEKLKKYFSYENSKIIKLNRRDIKNFKIKGTEISLAKGRFYPQGLLKGVPDVFEVNFFPFRCLDTAKNYIMCDLNHPLAPHRPQISVTIEDIEEKKRDSGSSCKHLFEERLQFSGMQTRFNNMPTDFFSGSPFAKNEPVSDNEFYKTPRLAAHTDSLCRKNITELYNKLMEPGKKILDIMTSVYSHIPKNKNLEVTGLGMNMAELEKNEQLTKRIIHNLNENPKLPFQDNSFDYATCAMSVEYISKPFEVFKEIERVLKPQGIFIITFSNRWFPGKEINIWNELHDFEKMGLVSEYFFNTKGFEKIHTYSLSGLPRPYEDNDRYKDTLWDSDPLYAVYASKK